MTTLDLRTDTHRRLNPLTGQWVLVSPHRTARPWQGQIENISGEMPSEHDPACYMCPGNTRANGARNPAYQSTFVFDNDFAALHANTPTERVSEGDLLVATGEPGFCRVICFSPRHDLTLARMPIADIRAVIDVWVEQVGAITKEPGIQYVQVFENRGDMMGASNPHPHCQIWATRHVPNEVATEDAHLQRYFEQRGTDLLGHYLELEQRQAVRLVCENAHFAVVVPFWAIWPFETLLIAKRRVADLGELASGECDALAEILKRLLTRYDNLFQAPCPYSMGFHLKPVPATDGRPWRLHAHFYPPVLRSSTIRKFMVGYEMLATPQRDITPEDAASRLSALSDQHYRD